MDGLGMTLEQFLDQARRMNAGVSQIVLRDADDKIMTAFILADGEGAGEIVEAVEAVTERWHEE